VRKSLKSHTAKRLMSCEHLFAHSGIIGNASKAFSDYCSMSTSRNTIKTCRTNANSDCKQMIIKMQKHTHSHMLMLIIHRLHTKSHLKHICYNQILTRYEMNHRQMRPRRSASNTINNAYKIKCPTKANQIRIHTICKHP